MLAVTALCSYPFFFLIDRGNLEGAVWFFAFLGLVFFARGRYLVSALFFGASICIKPFHGLFFFLFLAQRRYKEIAAAAVAICAANPIALQALGPTIAIA